ncbi:MAG TPA: VOC family protein [Candidatus Dormibacteraeota bacterium]
MQQRVSVITLGVADLAQSRAFYEKLGWTSDSKPEEGVVFFQAGCMVLALWTREDLAEDSMMQDNGGWGGVTLAYNVGSPEDVDQILLEARAAGATIGRSGGKTFWGGYNGIFIDPDGHPWEVAHNPFWTLRDDGSIELPKPS